MNGSRTSGATKFAPKRRLVKEASIYATIALQALRLGACPGSHTTPGLLVAPSTTARLLSPPAFKYQAKRSLACEIPIVRTYIARNTAF